VESLDQAVVSLVPPLVAWLTVSGLDDLALLAAWLVAQLRPHPPIPPQRPERPLAIFVPLWQEDAVIAAMITHNLTALHYQSAHFFIGAYPNDNPTVEAVSALESNFPSVHLCLVPHDGPTSKADCLNWIYQSMLIHEDNHGIRFAAIVTHDAEDLIHPDSFAAINVHLDDYDMIQVPVLPLPTPVTEIVHGIYIDEFSEFQVRDLRTRCQWNGFLPSAGVGTAFSRRAIERLAAAEDNRVFEPACLTEDYENGFRIHALGFRQILLPLRKPAVATREYFPRTWRAAVRQRTRWNTGIIWQGLEKHGWKGGLSQFWWHWRDRKGILGNPVSLLANGLALYSVLRWNEMHPLLAASPLADVFPFTVALAALQAGCRAVIVSHHFGARHGIASVFRIPAANLLNSVAAAKATWRYWTARLRRTPLVWLKTSHQYPNRFALEAHRPTLGEILVQSNYCTASALDAAIASKPPGIPIGRWLVERGDLSEEELYEAMSIQHCLPLEHVHPWDIPQQVRRALPLHVVKHMSVVPLRFEGGTLILGSPEPIEERAHQALVQYISLPVRVALLTRSNFEAIREQYQVTAP
jgi:bacteriophage N4 adsorption protein B